MTHYHFIGIGGIGMSGLAKIALAQKFSVSGSDVSYSTLISELQREGANISIGQSENNVEQGHTVILSSDIAEDNVEFLAAKKANCPILHRSDLLNFFMKQKKGLAVAGTHGKTTVSSLLAHTLRHAGYDPSFAVGGIVRSLKSNAHLGCGDYFVAEADESDGSFVKYHPFGAIITNIDDDHLSHYGTRKNLAAAFRQFINQVDSLEHLIFCNDDPKLKELKPVGFGYGFDKESDFRAINLRTSTWGTTFDVLFDEKEERDFFLPLPGRHNVLNALAVFALCHRLKVEHTKVREAISTFDAPGRRLDVLGEVNKVMMIDDYAHHPTEIRATLDAVREAMPTRQIIAVYQPHRFSRLLHLLNTFGDCFRSADRVFVTDIYASGEEPMHQVNKEAIVTELTKTHAIEIEPTEDWRDSLSFLQPHDVVVVLGAGDIGKQAAAFLQALQSTPPKPLSIALIKGGQTCEHEISLQSASFIEEALSGSLYDVKSVHITETGYWTLDGQSKQARFPGEVMQFLEQCDLIFPILHGPKGEDGTVQGLCELLNKPYVGSDQRSSAIAMDKAKTKALLSYNGIATSPFLTFSSSLWRRKKEKLRREIFTKLRFPLFVKAPLLGSSIGVIKVEEEDAFDQAVDEVFQISSTVLVEEGIVGRELEFAVLGSDDPVVFPPGEILTGGKVYDFQAKYGDEAMQATLEPQLPGHVLSQGLALVKRVFQLLGLEGMARIDCFLDKNQKFLVNEVNPLPGFTKISLYPLLCARSGVVKEELMHRLVCEAKKRHREQQRYDQHLIGKHHV